MLIKSNSIIKIPKLRNQPLPKKKNTKFSIIIGQKGFIKTPSQLLFISANFNYYFAERDLYKKS